MRRNLLFTAFLFFLTLETFPQQVLQSFYEENVPYANGTQASVKNAGDINGDSYEDMITIKDGIIKIYFGGVDMGSTSDIEITDVSSYSIAGDINGDGYDDLITRQDDIIKIYFGGTDMDNTADIQITGGSSYASAGDMNGDECDDIIIFDYSHFYLFLGNSLLNGNLTTEDANLIFQTREGTEYANSVGDLNNDGFDDVIIDDYRETSIFFGSENVSSRSDLQLLGEKDFESNGGNYFANEYTSAGDINSDGYDDIMITARYTGLSSTYQYYAYIYYGGEWMDNKHDLVLTVNDESDRFGESYSKGGDFNNDGYNDLIIGAFTGNNGAGAAYIYYGGPDVDEEYDLMLTRNIYDDSFGYSIAIGDVNGDGISDAIIGAPENYDNVLVYYGGANMDSTIDVTYKRSEPGVNFGYRIATADVNNDSYSDILVGYTCVFLSEDIASGTTIYTDDADIKMISTDNRWSQFGYSVDDAGDVNGDGYEDIIIGAYINVDNGAAYIYLGGASVDSESDIILNGNHVGEYSGSTVAGAGDLNGDGYDDVIVGSMYYEYAYIYFGGASMDTTADLSFEGEYKSMHGYYVAGAGDVNNDGFNDVIISQSFYTVLQDDSCNAYIYYGGTDMDNIADVTLTVHQEEQNQGIVCAGAGDINGDGFDDIIIGNPTRKGEAYIYYGGDSMDKEADIIIEGETENGWLGYSIAGTGDVNGDGYGDVIIGNSRDSRDAHAYIFFGGESVEQSMTTSDADITLGDSEADIFGTSVSGAGDLNNDGYMDVVCGGYNSDLNTGRVYVFYGAESMDAVYDSVFIGENEDDEFGISIAAVNDMNGDGLNEILIGASEYNENGKAYLYNYDIFTDIKDDKELPVEFALEQNYPNPFNPSTTINFSLPETNKVTLKIYNLLGEEVTTLINENMSAGAHSVKFDASNLSSGMYIYKINSGEYTATKKLMLLK